MKALPLPSPKVLLSLEFKRYYGQLRFPYGPNGTSFPYIQSLLPCTAPIRASRATPHDFPCVSPLLPRKPICRFWQFSLGQMHWLSPPDKRVSDFTLVFEATFRFACAATRRFARPTSWAFVREPCVSGYPSHLPPADMANCRTPMVGLEPTSHMSCTAYCPVPILIATVATTSGELPRFSSHGTFGKGR